MIVRIRGSYITIGQLLKKENFVNSGGESKFFLLENVVKINGIRVTTRSTKVRIDDFVWINDELIEIKAIDER
ncbi:S4-like RNA binding protein [Mesomycoplasma conjunctivae]|uniref:Uncharacterized protein n=1 Tax=Mesomycoplasma conjunctivae (strain ATCC 25834 / NCTC 10147 / HRC/581) TaxID=572263 RepID=C5J5G0_MESCH|nr:RNA-binding S4 domain-containing protein [Mesomycoplasma conjunctivae]CAT04682.1 HYPOTHETICAL PROTEIN MCJ_000030 [Mesomycoplasma conjunctivae]VEU65648.1 S4-like RNA binding protein [Mesomycoplasma conjunctivae]